MKVMKEDIEFTCRITLFIVASLACLSVFVYSSISIDKSKLSEIPNKL